MLPLFKWGLKFHLLKFNQQIFNTKQEDCSDDEVDPDVDTSNLPEHQTPGQILHIDAADAQHLTGSVMNDFCCEIVQVCINFTIWNLYHIRIPLTTQKMVELL